MPPDRTTRDDRRDALVIGNGPFIEGRLSRVLDVGQFRVHQKVDLSHPYALGLVGLPGGPEVALLFSAGVKLIGVDAIQPGDSPPPPSWPFEAIVHDQMSAEDILHVCNDVYWRNRGTRRHRRLPVSLEVVVVGKDRVLRTTTANMSAGGVFIRSLNPFPRESSVRVRLVQDQSIDEIQGRVLYTIGLLGEHIVHEDQPECPVVAHPGMAVAFSEGQDDIIDRWMRFAQLRHEVAEVAY
jgi:hypothetical protein